MHIRRADLDRFRPVGDEDCGVALECRDCGRPVAYHPGISPAYVGDPAVVQADSVEALLLAAANHIRRVHPTH